MHPDNINTGFLNAVVASDIVDTYLHLGLSSDDGLIETLTGLKAIVMSGSGERVRNSAQYWSSQCGGTEIMSFPSDDRFVARYTGGVLFVSHGMGMPSASIALHELLRMCYVIFRGDLTELDRLKWVRFGTSGGIGIPAGSIVVTTQALLTDLTPYQLRYDSPHTDGHFSMAMGEHLVKRGNELGLPMAAGITVSTDDFYVDQRRIDGAIVLDSPDSRHAWLTWLRDNGVLNIEMEGAVVAAFLNAWGFRHSAMITTTLVDRLDSDRITLSSAEQLDRERSILRLLHDLLSTEGDERVKQ